MTLPTLAYPDPHKPYDVHTDASMFGLGAIIVQNGRPVAFASRTLTPAEKNYSTTEQEALCVVYALNHFYQYLYGAVFTIYTDHAALKCILSKKEPKGRIARWVLAIQAFQFTIIHRKGIANKDADALSRRDQVNNQQASVSNGSYGSSSYDSSSGERDDEDTNDPEISIQNFKRYQKDDQRIQVILKQGVKRPFLWVNEILYYEYDDKKQVPVLPASMVKTLLRHVHNAPTSGHFGVDKTLEKARQMAWWCSMKEDIKLWIQHCEKCQRFKTRTTSSVAPLKPIVPTRLGEIWAADIAILPISSKGNRYMLVMMEYLSKWVVTVALPSFDSDHVAQAILYEIVLKIGLPERLITDNGSHFASDAMKNVCARLGIKRSMTSVESPQTDGSVERMNRTLKTSLAMAVDKEPHLWDEYLQFVTFAYNTSKQASTGFSPFQVLYGREAVLPLDKDLIVVPKAYETETWVNYLNKYLPILHGQVIENIKRAQGYQKKFYDKEVKVKYDYKVGDLISRQNLEKLTFPKERWSGPWIIVDKNDTDG